MNVNIINPKYVNYDDPDLYKIPLGDNWKIDNPDPKKLYVGCTAIRGRETNKEELKKEFSVTSDELLEVYQGFAIITFLNELKCLSVVEKKQGCEFKKKPLTLVPSCHSLSRGRIEIIEHYQLKSLVLLSQPINESSRRDITEVVNKYGKVLKLDISEGIE